MDLEQQIEMIKHSSWFDAEWYLRAYPDVASLDMCPASHFARYGWRVGRNPSAAFHTRGYQQQNRDVAVSGVNPLIHFLQHGEKENRRAPAVPTSEHRVSADRAAPPAPKQPQPSAGSLPDDIAQRQSLQLEHTQQLLEHYFRRCQELELRQGAPGDAR
ncbi:MULTISPECIES: hypothetical protein [unclassified Halomonas]|uniref:hypothetical protein n=1 Tax=unclassified Halomonas TaxID=2609666 RepID=UPI002887A9C4|nr:MULTISPECIES: hypothetical protein [unclassified Halomonas]MDT0500413.1 hypothetical protein [Halomonas sp. PAR7]MDT0511690.1 hypothetical protein [Halomonas sp. LES1]MDT0590022.1 hypothetical protein [Halomonas sp. PAR8]